MSDFDELFENVNASAMAELIKDNPLISYLRDSKIILVTEYDEPSLKAGEYWYNEEENTLYVGSGVIDSTVLYITNFIKHSTSFKYIPAPRYKTSVSVQMPLISHYFGIRHKQPSKRLFFNAVNIPNITHNSATRKTNVVKALCKHSVEQPNITHITEVQ